MNSCAFLDHVKGTDLPSLRYVVKLKTVMRHTASPNIELCICQDDHVLANVMHIISL